MGFFDQLKMQLTSMFDSFTGANEEFFEALEETLILADLGVETATTAIERLREVTKERALRPWGTLLWSLLRSPPLFWSSA